MSGEGVSVSAVAAAAAASTLPLRNVFVYGSLLADEVLLGITDRELDVLDTFEDVEYERRAVEVSLAIGERNIVVIWCRLMLLTSDVTPSFPQKLHC
ncbi:hypothetical protein COCNU_02G019720 [Cocos nucifera]|uniref:AIG2-like protein n=1 Tax=Cocos nucifera TaxID=13894 RepID=A0A8K0I1K6_COCNU|nr:hypothetical protein COCNU_02G019720 [Cocos nucifera]